MQETTSTTRHDLRGVRVRGAGRLTRLLLAVVAVVPAYAQDDVAAPPPVRPPSFEEVAKRAGIDFHHQNGMTGKRYFAEMMGSGAALFDADGDGDLDLYLVQGGALEPLPAGARRPSDRLFRNDLETGPDGRKRVRFVEVTAAAGLAEATGYGMGVAAGDIDGDGRVDLYVTNLGVNQLWRNVSRDGVIRFEDITAASGTDDPRWSVPAVFLDFDGDGVLDLFVGNYVDFRLVTHKTCSGTGGAPDYCSPNAYRPEPDRLFRGLGSGADGTVRFEDVTSAAGLSEAGAALGVAVDDFDGDGLVDLYVANDGMANRLYLNQGSGENGVTRFLDDALLTGTAVNEAGQPEASMGVVAGDVDGDGSPDLFVTHLERETNTLYLNDGQGLFRDRSRESGLGNTSWRFTGFGTALIDADVDGIRDLYVANGAVTVIEAQRAAGKALPLEQTDLFFRGQGSGRFVDATATAGPALARPMVSRGVAAGDVDNDGDPDLVVVSNHGPVLLLLSRADPPRAAWLGLRLVTADGKRDALGARVEIERKGAPAMIRRVGTGGSYASSSDSRVLVGLGGHPPTRVVVQWPNGRRERFAGIVAGRYQTLRAGTGEALP